MAQIEPTATFEVLMGKAPGRFDEDGEWEHEGATRSGIVLNGRAVEFWWDSGETVTDEEGNIVVLDQNGDPYAAFVTEEGVEYVPVDVDVKWEVSYREPPPK